MEDGDNVKIINLLLENQDKTNSKLDSISTTINDMRIDQAKLEAERHSAPCKYLLEHKKYHELLEEKEREDKQRREDKIFNFFNQHIWKVISIISVLYFLFANFPGKLQSIINMFLK